ncbi:hypothetical protein SAMN05421752_11422 [Natronorubrum thiooxidans]|uniref:Uncharacterized protein n=1 Tax=Natronorubrum thiooxidans TaxID=308853 RepID=A0A1N7GPL9_9EURY|nr:hypothetical protein SAMN05421752_11422 [Natronorubrum thiooxidans]
MREGSFVPASQLYDVRSQTPIAHPAHQATDEDVRRALEAREIRTDGGLRDVLIYVPDFESVRHKLASNLEDDEIAYWSVHGTPRQTGAGATVLFSDGNRVVATGDVVGTSENRLWIDSLERDNRANPAEPVTRGFKYV